MKYPFLSLSRTSKLKKIPQALVLGGLLVIGNSLLTLTPVMAAGIQTLASFDGTNGALPVASLTLGTDGLFYGTTRVGNGIDGTIFSFNPTGNVLTSLASFDGTNGSIPRASLTLGTDGLFYGTTSEDFNLLSLGTIFSFNPIGNTLTSLASFDGNNGARPDASLTLGTDGLFYGTTVGGGNGGGGKGTIFSFNPNSSTRVPDSSSLLGLLTLGTLGNVSSG